MYLEEKLMTSTSEQSGYKYKFEIDLEKANGKLVYCFNDGNNHWDSNNGSNYTFGAGYNSITLDMGTATKLKCCFNNGGSQWDNNGGSDYTIETNALYNTVYIRDGVIQTHPF